MKKLIFLFTFGISISLLSQTPCENGLAGIYPCNQITLQSHVATAQLQGTQVNDIWGWTDPESGKEYALVGLSDGVTFVDITTPITPIVIGKLIETHDHGSKEEPLHGESAWRDIKVYANHAYVVSDLNEEHGMQVFDLTQLRDFDGSEIQTFTETARYTGVGSAHNMVINEDTGYGYIVGISSGSGSCAGGGLHILDLNEPANPQYVGCFDNDGYTHDAQCVIYNGSDSDYQGMEICFNSNEDTFTIVNTNNKDAISMISRKSYTDAGYTHQGWLSEDHNYFFMNDEFDEGNHGYHPRTIIWDVRDLDNPLHIGEFYNEAISIDHNLYTHNDLIYESNYSSGLRVIDYSRVSDAQLREVAFFDTQPHSDVIAFEGSWSNYPYFESGNIIVSDMANGLFILKLELTNLITSHPENQKGCGGTDHTFQVNTNSNNVSYQWQVKDNTNFTNLTESSHATGISDPILTIGLNKNTAGNEYRVKIEDENGTIHYSFPAVIDYLDPPYPEFSITRTENTITISNSTENASEYMWNFGDGQTSTEFEPTHTYLSGGSYAVTLTASNECSESSTSSQTDIPLGIVESGIKIYPNPASISLYVNISQTRAFQIFDLSGGIRMDGLINLEAKQIDVSNLESGVYLLILELDKSAVSQKFSIK